MARLQEDGLSIGISSHWARKEIIDLIKQDSCIEDKPLAGQEAFGRHIDAILTQYRLGIRPIKRPDPKRRRSKRGEARAYPNKRENQRNKRST